MAYETVEMIIADRERLRAEVERLKRERDELQSQFDRMSGIAEEFRHQRDRAYEESTAIGVALEDARSAAMEEAAHIVESRPVRAVLVVQSLEQTEIAAAIRAAARETR